MTKKRTACTLGLLISLFIGGCQSQSARQWTGLTSPVKVTSEPWSYNMQTGQALKTQHYIVYTTITDPQVLQTIPQVLEGGYQQYQKFVTAPMQGTGLMRCFIFSKRAEWVEFTRTNTGMDAAIYLQITRGGYTIGDRFVSYYVGDNSTYSVTAHEGWHQYVFRHLKGRLPPFLEEGTACMFETVKFSGGLPRWDLSINPNRAQGLRRTLEGRHQWPLEKLVAMHAGDVVRLPGDRIEAFYSQDWAFARFLWEYNNGQYRPAFKKLLSDTAAGTPFDPSGTMTRAHNLWSPSSVQPMLEHYLGKPLREVEVEFQKFEHQIAYEQFDKQWDASPN